MISVLPGAVLLVITLGINYLTFGYLTPTTARLKIGASPSLDYSLDYLHQLTFDFVTILHVIIPCLLIIMLFGRFFSETYKQIIIAGCVLTIGYAAYNSDVFIGGRMFYGSGMVLFLLVATSFPAIIKFENLKNLIHQDLRSELERVWNRTFIRSSILILISVVLLYAATRAIVFRASEFVVRDLHADSGAIPHHYQLITWINEHLDPDDGSVGLFFLGTGYHLPAFELADFLGKADEDIAGSDVKWGPPGHNKWDLDFTINKWNPQVIIPAASLNPEDESLMETAESYTSMMSPNSWNYELVLNRTVMTSYQYCFLDDSVVKYRDTWGMFVRNDIATQHPDLNCVNSQTELLEDSLRNEFDD